MNLTGQTILVTGGTKGIGRAIVDQLLGHDPKKIIVVARNISPVEDLAAKDVRVIPIASDLSNPQDIDALGTEIAADHPDLSVLVNNAGVQHMTELTTPSAPMFVEPLRTEIALNFEGVISLTLRLMPTLLAQDRAMIVNVTSGLALAPKKSSPVYCATKAGIRSFTKSLRNQAASSAPQLTVVEALPPLVDTEMTEGRGSGKVSPEACAREIVEGMVAGKSTIYVAKSKLLRVIQGISPSLADKVMANG